MSGYGQFMFGAPAGSAVLTEDDATGNDSDWVPYTPPPSVKVEDSVVQGSNNGGGSSFLDTLFGTKKSDGGVVGTLVNIFGQLVHPNGQSIPNVPPPTPTPIWVYLAVPVALIGVVALIRRKPRAAVAGYGRRSRTRRSKR